MINEANKNKLHWSCWVMNFPTFKHLMALEDADGNPLVTADTRGCCLLGRAVNIKETMRDGQITQERFGYEYASDSIIRNGE